MQITSETWDSLYAAGALLESRVTINGTTYTPISAPEITRALMGNGFNVGGCNSALCVFVLDTTDIIPKSAEVLVEMRLGDDTTPSEWLPCGTFYISKRQRDPVSGRIALTCYDSMLKAAAPFEYRVQWVDSNGNRVVDSNGNRVVFRPAYTTISMATAVSTIADAIGVTVDNRSAISTEWTIPPQDGVSMTDILAGIGAAHGGNWIITPENKLRLVPLIDAANAPTADTIAEITAVTGDYRAVEAQTITGIKIVADGAETLYGDNSGLVVNASSPYFNSAIITALQAQLIGQTYQPFTLITAMYTPAAEIGDFIKYGDMYGVLYNERAVYDGGFFGDLTTPDPGEVTDEYPYIGGTTKALTEAKEYAQELTEALDSELDQEGVFNRLTNGGRAEGVYLEDGKLYINASYIVTGIITDKHGKNKWDLENGAFRMDDGTIDLRSSDGNAGFSVGKYGDVAIGQKPEDMSSFEDNRCGFQVDNGGNMKIMRINLYGAVSDDDPFVRVGTILAAAGDNGFAMSDKDGFRKLFIGTNGCDLFGFTNAKNGFGFTGGITVNPDSNNPQTGVGTATFATGDGRTVTVTDGIITNIS